MRTVAILAKSEGTRDGSGEQPEVAQGTARQRAAAHWARCREASAYVTLREVGNDLMRGRIPAEALAGRAASLNQAFRAARRAEAMPETTRSLVDLLAADFDVNPEAPIRIDALRRFLTRECGLQVRRESDLLIREETDYADTIEVAPALHRLVDGSETWCCTIEVLQGASGGPAVIFVDYVCPPEADLQLHGTVFDARSTRESLYFVPCLSAVDGLEDAVAFKRNAIATHRVRARLERLLAGLEDAAALAIHHFTEGYGEQDTRHAWSVDVAPADFHLSDRARSAAWIGLSRSLPIPRATMLNLTCALADHALREVLGVTALIERRGLMLRSA